LFVGGHPVLWAGSIENWIRACDYILSLDVDVIVPGHGPIAEKPAVRELKSYFEYVAAEARAHFDNGVPYEEAARKINLDRFAGWLDPERIVINVASLYDSFQPESSTRRPRGAVRRDETVPGCLRTQSYGAPAVASVSNRRKRHAQSVTRIGNRPHLPIWPIIRRD
jgi:hypothetical protein